MDAPKHKLLDGRWLYGADLPAQFDVIAYVIEVWQRRSSDRVLVGHGIAVDPRHVCMLELGDRVEINGTNYFYNPANLTRMQEILKPWLGTWLRVKRLKDGG